MSNKIIVKDHKYYFKIRGLGGVKGDKGDTGPAGPQGPQGPYVNVVAGTTTTLSAGSSAQVTVNNAGNTSVLNFGIPQGAKGDKGDTGAKGDTGPQGQRGPQGNTGPAGLNATVTVGTTTTGAAGTNANVTNSGTGNQAVLNFTIPQGAKGDTGATGPQGPKGDTGATGPQGPRGYTGGIKSTVVAELPDTGESDKYYLVNRTAEGGTITTTDGYAQVTNDENAGDLTLNKLDGNATQETIAGKNLWGGFASDFTKTVGGITFTTKKDGTITTTAGTSNASGYSLTSAEATDNGFTINLTAGTYTLSGGTSQPVFSAVAGGQEYRADSQTGKITFALASDSTCFIRLTLGSGVTVSAQTIKPMLEVGSTASDYEPYCGGVPSPNPSYPQAVNVVSGAQTVKITGKNLWGGLGGSCSRSTGDIDFQTNSDGTITASGVASATAYSCNNALASSNNIYTRLKAGTYYLSTESTPPTGVVVRIGNISDATTIAQSPHSFTLTEDTDVYISLRVDSGTNISSGITVKPMVERNNQATTYESYYGQSQEINLGKNLFDKQTLGLGKNWAGSVGTICYPYTDQSVRAVGLIPVNPNTTYTLQLLQSDWYIMQVLQADSSYEIIHNITITQGTTLNITFTTMSQTAYIGVKFKYGSAGTTDITSDLLDSLQLQLEAGTQATTYAPYKTPIELAKLGDYQDYIWNDNGTWKIHKEVGKKGYNGSGLPTAYGSGNTQHYYCYYYSAPDDSLVYEDSTMTGIIMSDYFTEISWTNILHATGDTPAIALRSNHRVYFRVAQSTAENFQTWLSTHNTTVYYALATPTDTIITDSDLIEQLDHIYSLYGGVNNLWLIPSAGPQGEFTGDYVVYDKYNQHKVYIWSSDDNTWQIILP